MCSKPRRKHEVIHSRIAAAAIASLCTCGLARADDFFMGSDVSLISWEQQEGMTFANTNGVVGNADQILYNNGDNLFRLRLFVNPQTTYSNTNFGAIQTTAYDIALAQQLKADDPSAKFELDFQYSDTWASPGTQTTPAAWSGQSLTTMESTIKNYTTTTLQSFEASGVAPDIVQVGNEINGGMDWPNGEINFNGSTSQQEASWAAFGGLLNNAIAGVRAAQITGAPKMQVSVVIGNGNSSGEPAYFFGDLTNPLYGNVPASSFDIAGVDYYPTKTTDLATTQSNLDSLISTVPGFSTKKIMVMETDAPWESTSVKSDPTYPDTPTGQEDYLLALANMVKGLPNNDGMGVLYWYPESVQVPGQYDYNGGATALFNNGTPHVATQGIDAFAVSQTQWMTQGSGTGNWNTGANWTSTPASTVPNGVGIEADFLAATSGTQNVVTSSAITLGTVRFDNTASYVIGGTGSLTLQDLVGSANVVVQAGTQTINVPTTIATDTVFTVSSGASLQMTAPVTVNAGTTLTPAGSGTVTYSSSISLASGAKMSIGNSTSATSLTLASTGIVNLTGAGTVLQVNSLSNNGTIDVQSNEMLINYTPGFDPFSAIFLELNSGYASGAWTGTGITSSSAAASGGTYGVGLVDGNAGVNGATVSGNTLEIAYSLYGDANLDGKVDASDFSIFAPNFGLNTTLGWEAGDFNYDGKVDAGDFSLFAPNFGLQSNGTALDLPAADWAALDAFASANGLSLTSVPEPASTALAVWMGISILAMRRRRI
jgi:arabinogalactan endo-1,4-beta-galactosidase